MNLFPYIHIYIYVYIKEKDSIKPAVVYIISVSLILFAEEMVVCFIWHPFFSSAARV